MVISPSDREFRPRGFFSENWSHRGKMMSDDSEMSQKGLLTEYYLDARVCLQTEGGTMEHNRVPVPDDELS